MFMECEYEFVNTSSVCLNVEKDNNNIWDDILGVILFINIRGVIFLIVTISYYYTVVINL